MKLSKKVDYGVRVLLDLAQHYGLGLTQTSDIAQRQGIPEPYLDQLLTVLRRAGFVDSRRGPQGGHSLTRPASEINLAEVMVVLESRTSPRCVAEPSDCSRSVGCGQRDIWRQIEEQAQQLLQTTTIGQLAEIEGQRQENRRYIAQILFAESPVEAKRREK